MPLYFAIIGCGNIGKRHAEYIQAAGKLIGVCDIDKTKATETGKKYNATVFFSIEELLQSEAKPDVVVVCTPNGLHARHSILSLQSGCHVLCEKPLAISVSAGEEMSRKATEQTRLLFTAFTFRFDDEVRVAIELIDTGSLGGSLNFRLMFGGYIDMHGQWYSQKALSGGGIIMDNGPHAADLMRFLFGDIKTITAQVARIQDLEVEDRCKAAGGVGAGAAAAATGKSMAGVSGMTGTGRGASGRARAGRIGAAGVATAAG